MNRNEFEERFTERQGDDLSIMQRKNDDYADSSDPFKNFRMVEDMGLMSVEKGLLVRMSDKFQRIANLVQRDGDASVDDETVRDTLSDLRNYAMILDLYLEQKDDEKPKIPLK